MVERLSDKWRDYQAAVYRRAEQLTLPYSHRRQPIPLSQLTCAQRVTQVEFDEMTVDGGLLVHDSGFEIHVACARSEIEQFRDYFQCGADHMLPPKARFTIAHELTHTFLYDLKPRRPKSRVGRHDGEHDSLERTCNRGAARLLVPERLLDLEFKLFPKVDAAYLRGFAKEMRVSPVSLVRRLELSSAWGAQRMGAVYTKREGQNDVVRAGALDTELALLLPEIKYGAPMQVAIESAFSPQLFGDSGTVAGGKEWVRGTRRVSQELMLSFVRVSDDPVGHLITIQCVGRQQTLNLSVTKPEQTFAS